MWSGWSVVCAGRLPVGALRSRRLRHAASLISMRGIATRLSGNCLSARVELDGRIAPGDSGNGVQPVVPRPAAALGSHPLPVRGAVRHQHVNAASPYKTTAVSNVTPSRRRQSMSRPDDNIASSRHDLAHEPKLATPPS